MASTRAAGTFDVKLTPIPAADGRTTPGRLSIEKTFHGDLEAESHGEMLAAGTAVKGSAGYVAIEEVSGTLAGRSGTFVLQHHGLMNRGAPSFSVTVVPDSGTGELAGIAGTMTIEIRDGKHVYGLDYSFGEPA